MKSIPTEQMRTYSTVPAKASSGARISSDIWGAHNAGIRAVYIRPIALNTVFRKIRYGIEAPFRLLCRMRGERV